jgi:hypothetical protein
MAKKRTFSSGRRGSSSQRPRLSYGELEQRRRMVERETRQAGAEPPRRASQKRSKPPAMPETSNGAQKARVSAKTRERRGFSGVTLAVVGIGALAIFLLVWFLFFVMPSPIGSLTPANGGAVKTSNVEVKATISKSFKPQDVTLKVDGKDSTPNLKVNKQTVSSVVALADGSHKAFLHVKTGGLVSNRTATWSFNVDSTPPKVTVTSKKVTPTKNIGEVNIEYAGTVEGGSNVKAGGQPIAVDKKGQFKGSAVAPQAKSFEISATDPAGNVGTAFIVTQKVTQAKGVHVSVFIAASDSDFTKMIGLVQRTELNALEVDLKDEAGQIGYASDYPLAQQAKAANNWVKLESCVDQMRYNNVYSICRIVCFKDPKLAKVRPDLVVHDSTTGGLWSKGVWLDPYSKEVWDYDLAVAEAAAKAGFNEIQFDYVRFPSDGNTTTCLYPHKDARPPVQVIDSFLVYARERLAPYNVFISADLFGLTASKQGEMGIGQSVADVAKRVDYISPMVYPSHYNVGEYNIKVPEANPGDTVSRSLEDFKRVMAGKPAKLRPWLQDFSLKIAYTPDMVRRQIDACEKLGVNQWLLWDPDCTYSEAALKKQ